MSAGCFIIFCISFLSVTGGLRAAAYEPDSEEDCGKRGLFWTLSRHPAQLHEGHTGCEHQLCGVRVHAVWIWYSKVDSAVVRLKESKSLKSG